MRIAIVESDELLSDLISFRLELLGREVIIWNSATEMLAALPNADIDLLIVDIFQPDMKGWEAIQKVRASYPASELPVLALSIDTDLTLVELAFKAGANDYLIAPFDPANLQAKTDALLLNRQQMASR